MVDRVSEAIRRIARMVTGDNVIVLARVDGQMLYAFGKHAEAISSVTNVPYVEQDGERVMGFHAVVSKSVIGRMEEAGYQVAVFEAA